MAQDISTNGKTGRDVRRYLNEIRYRDLNGCPDYLSAVTDQGYLVGDRYAYRILNTLTSMPGDLGNNLSFFASDPYYNAGAKWVVPYIYPLDRNYETDYQGIPPAQFALRALSMGGLCLVQEEDMKGCMALVIFEIPKDYPFRSIEEDVKRVVSGVLGTHPRQTRVLVSTCPVDAISVTIFLLRPKTNFLDQWCTESTDGDRKKALQSHWYSRTQTDGRELTGPWAGIINAMVATSYDARSPNESMEDIRQQLEKKAFRKAAESSEINICDDFAAYAKQVGLI